MSIQIGQVLIVPNGDETIGNLFDMPLLGLGQLQFEIMNKGGKMG